MLGPPLARLRRSLRELGRFAAETACPPVCAACLKDVDHDGPVPWPLPLLCAPCRAALLPDRRGFCLACGADHEGPARHARQNACQHPEHRNLRGRCLYWMRGPLPPMIHQFKYRGVTRLAGEWGPSLGALLLPLPPRDGRIVGGASACIGDLVLPVPLHPARERERGYNQSALLARAAAAHAGLPCVEDALRRVRRTATQTVLGPQARRRNLAGAFEVTRPTLVRGRRLVLVDDVITTGATLSAAVNALIASGAVRVAVIAVARA